MIKYLALILLMCACKTQKSTESSSVMYITNWATVSMEYSKSSEDGYQMVSPWVVLHKEGSITKNTYKGQTCILSEELGKVYRRDLEKLQ